MIRFLIPFMITMTLTSEAAMRRLATAFEHSPPIFSPVLRTFSSIPVVVDSHNPNKKYGYMIKTNWEPQRDAPPKRDGFYRHHTDFCKPAQERVTQRLVYTTKNKFTDADIDAAFRPEIPAIAEIKTPEDIIRIAAFYRHCGNHITAHYMQTKEILNLCVNSYRLAFTYEPKFMLDMIRPPLMTKMIRDRMRENLKRRELSPKYETAKSDPSSNGLGFDDEEYYNDNKHCKGWKDLIVAGVRFERLVYGDISPGIMAYTTEEEFNEALKRIDPSFSTSLAEDDSNNKTLYIKIDGDYKKWDETPFPNVD